MHERMLKVSEAADYLDVSRRTVQRWIEEGRIAHLRVGPYGSIRITEQEVLRLRKPQPVSAAS